jgi:uncharacterized protein YlxW (UPF0749 family)
VIDAKRRPDESMTLLNSMLERPLDPGYREAANRREAAGLPRSGSTRSVLVLVLAILTGFLFAVAALSLRPKPTAAAEVKDQLVSRIEGLQTHASEQEGKVAGLTKEVRDYEALALRQTGGDVDARLNDLEVQAGAVPLTGPGLTMTLDDAASVDAAADAGARPSSDFEEGRVTSGDLQIIVNGLWGAGAEAISINGHRLSSTAAIRFAGKAIIVDFRPLSRPYVITVLGNGQGIQQIFDQSFAGVYLAQLVQEFKIRSVVKQADSLTVPADSGLRLQVAQPLDSAVGSAAPSISTQTTPTTPSTATPTIPSDTASSGSPGPASSEENPP